MLKGPKFGRRKVRDNECRLHFIAKYNDGTKVTKVSRKLNQKVKKKSNLVLETSIQAFYKILPKVFTYGVNDKSILDSA